MACKEHNYVVTTQMLYQCLILFAKARGIVIPDLKHAQKQFPFTSTEFTFQRFAHFFEQSLMEENATAYS